MWIRGHFENKRSGSFAELVIEQVLVCAYSLLTY